MAGMAGAVLHSRICAAVTAASCLMHLGLAAGNQHGTWLNLLMLAMVAVCLPCAVHIWRHGRARALRQVMAAALAMTAVHAVLLLGTGSGGGGHGHHGPAAATAAAAGAAPAGSGALLAVIALEMTTALLAATLLARLRAQPRG
jgi:Kef-type K+ transport system membrane component KefB